MKTTEDPATHSRAAVPLVERCVPEQTLELGLRVEQNSDRPANFHGLGVIVAIRDVSGRRLSPGNKP